MGKNKSIVGKYKEGLLNYSKDNTYRHKYWHKIKKISKMERKIITGVMKIHRIKIMN